MNEVKIEIDGIEIVIGSGWQLECDDDFMKMIIILLMHAKHYKPLYDTDPLANFVKFVFATLGTGKIIHEFGHHIELAQRSMLGVASDWIKRRARNAKLFSKFDLDQLDPRFDAGEEAVFGPFFHPYIGRKNKDGWTEAVSMGLAEMLTNPVLFYEKDPGHFMMILKFMQGNTK